ncbi:MAG: HAD family hydrolase [Lachnospiraceae bacterium]|nr:HAD family hydrolase [Lachnospiraceae bacterium]
MYQNYIFDLYGTLVDICTNENSPYLWRKMSDIYSALGAVYTARELKLAYQKLVKVKLSEAAEHLQHAEPDLTEVFAGLFRDKGVSCDREQARFVAVTFRTLSRTKLGLYDGVIDFLEHLRLAGKGIYLLSNAQEDFTRPELDKLGLVPYFDGILISSEEGVKKPSPLFFQRLLERYELDPASCVMIGNDEHSDIAGARAVGMDCLYIHTAISPEVTGPVDADYLVMDGDFRRIENLILR